MDCAVTSTRTGNLAPAITGLEVCLSRTAPVGLGLLDRQLRFQQFNDALTQLSGIPAEAHVGRRVDEVFPQMGRKVMTALGRVAAGTKRAAVMEVIPHPPRASAATTTNGPVPRQKIWRLLFRSEGGGSGGLISVVAMEVTALRRFRERAGSQQAFQEVLTQISGTFVNLTADRVDPTIEDALRRLVEFLGVQRMTLSQTNARNRFEITHSYSVPGFGPLPRLAVDDAFPWLAGVLRSGQVVRLSSMTQLPPEAEEEREWTAKTGIRAHISIPFSVAGSPLYALSVASGREREWPLDVIPRLRLAGTIFANALARKRAEEDLQHTRESLAHMARVTTVGQLATSIAHEINQPLCAMVSNAQAAVRFLSARKPDVREALCALADIVVDGKRAGDVIARAHEMLKRQDVKFSPQDVNRLIRCVAPLLENYAMIRRVRVVTDLAPDLPAILGHAVQLQQVVTNLVVNAVDAIPPERAAADGRVAISTMFDPSSHAVAVRVADNGVGLPADGAERVFRPFYTSKPAGLGMGLPISRSIVEAHGGRLWAEPNSGGGTIFGFSMPVRQETHHDDGDPGGADRG